MGGGSSSPASPAQPPGPSAEDIRRQQRAADLARAAAEAERQRQEEQRREREAKAAARARELQEREAAVRAAEAARSRELEQRRRAAQEAQEREEQARRQVPPFLRNHFGKVNIAVVGNTGVGKSSFVNAVRGLRPGDAGWAKVGVTETTVEPAAYEFSDTGKVFLWDIPGAATDNFPLDAYIRTFGLRHFDVCIILTADRFTETETLLLKEVRASGKSVFMARSKVDIAIRNNQEDNGASPEDTKQAIRDDMKHNGVEDPYLFSSRKALEHDFHRLLSDVRGAANRALASRA